MPPSWRERYGQRALDEMDQFRRAVALTERGEPQSLRSQSWSYKVHKMKRISENIDCKHGDDLLEEDGEAGGRWEQHVDDEHRLSTAGIEPVEVIHPGRVLQLEIAKYHREELYEKHPAVFYDSSDESSDEEDAARGGPVLACADGHEGKDDSTSDYSDPSNHSGISRNKEGGFINDVKDRASGIVCTNDTTGGLPRTVQSVAPDNAPETQADAHRLNLDDPQDGSPSTSSSETGAVPEDLDAEKERLAAVFSDFPTCINRTQHLTDIEDKHYGLSVVARDPAWLYIDNKSLTRRVREWIADFISKSSPCFPAHVCA